MKITALGDPFFLARRALRAEIAGMSAGASGLLLDVGCGTAPYRDLFAHVQYVGIEVATASKHGSGKSGADLLFDGLHIPLADASVDTVLCNQVLEHVFEPIAFLHELHRVLRTGGRLMLTVPFVWDEHEQPHDYARYSSFGLRYLAGKCGFEVETQRRTLSDASLFAQLWLAYLFKVVRGPRPTPARKAALAALSMPINLLGLAMARLLPDSPDLYLDNVVLLVRMPQRTCQ